MLFKFILVSRWLRTDCFSHHITCRGFKWRKQTSCQTDFLDISLILTLTWFFASFWPCSNWFVVSYSPWADVLIVTCNVFFFQKKDCLPHIDTVKIDFYSYPDPELIAFRMLCLFMLKEISFLILIPFKLISCLILALNWLLFTCYGVFHLRKFLSSYWFRLNWFLVSYWP